MSKKFILLRPLFLLFLALNLLLIGAGFYLSTWFKPVDPTAQTTVAFVIPKGQSLTKIGERLTEAGLIRSPWAFRFLVKKDNLGNKIQAGSFKLSPSMTLDTIGKTLTTGTEDVWVTIQEGWRKEEIAESLVRQNFTEFDAAEFLELAEDSEGKLFPDTYLVPKQITAKQFFDLLTKTFDRKIMTLNLEESGTGLSTDELIILASIVEREGLGIENMRYVAGILQNRLKIGMPLQVDASLQYAGGYSKSDKTWWPEPLAKDKEINSLFNTYLNPGLPPGAICNPGLEAIKAVANPIESDYLYYLHDGGGVGHYATTYEGHLSNINKYLRPW